MGLPPLDETGSHTIPSPATPAPAGPVELDDAISWAAHTAFQLDRPTDPAEARHFLRHLASNAPTTTTRKDIPR